MGGLSTANPPAAVDNAPTADSDILSSPAVGASNLTHLAECLRDAVGDHYDWAPIWADPQVFPSWHDNHLIDAFDWEGATTAFLDDVLTALAERKQHNE